MTFKVICHLVWRFFFLAKMSLFFSNFIDWWTPAIIQFAAAIEPAAGLGDGSRGALAVLTIVHCCFSIMYQFEGRKCNTYLPFVFYLMLVKWTCVNFLRSITARIKNIRRIRKELYLRRAAMNRSGSTPCRQKPWDKVYTLNFSCCFHFKSNSKCNVWCSFLSTNFSHWSGRSCKLL